MGLYSGNISYSANRPDLGDGDEPTFQINETGSISLSINISGSSVSGTATASISASGFTNTDGDGDNDAFSDVGSGSSQISGTTGAITSIISLSDGGTLFITGSLNSDQSIFSGTAELLDDGADGGTLDLTVPISLSGSGVGLPTISQASDLIRSTTGINLSAFDPADVMTTATDFLLEKGAVALSKLNTNPKAFFAGVPTTLRNALVYDLNLVEGELKSVPFSKVGWKQAGDAAGNLVKVFSLARDTFLLGSTALSDYQRNGAITSTTQDALIKFDASLMSGIAGEVVGSLGLGVGTTAILAVC
jgi:hypothetical protein